MNPLVTSLIASSRHRLAPYPRFTIPLASNATPSNNDITYTFARNSTATYIDEDGVLQNAAIDVPRFQNGRYLAELDATNIILYSKALSSWSIGNCTVTPDAIITPIGLASDKLSQTNTVASNIYQIRTLSVSTSYCFSFLIKNIDAIRSRFSPYNLSASTQLGELLIGWTGSVPSTYSNTGFTSVSYTDMSDGWYLVVCCITTAASGTSHTIRFYPEYSVTTGKSIYLTRIQVEAGVRPTSYIPTTAPVTREADVLHYDVSSVITQGQGSLYCEFWDGNISGPIRRVLNISDGTNSNRLYVYIGDNGTLTTLGVTAGTTVISIASGNITSTLNKLVLTYKDNEVILYCNGTKRGEDLSGTIPTNFTTLSIGCSHDGALQLNSEIGNVKYFKKVLTPAEAIKLTTL